MLSKLLNYLNMFNTTPAKPPEAPYKIETPVAEASPAKVMEAAVKEKIAKPAAKKTSKPRVKKQ